MSGRGDSQSAALGADDFGGPATCHMVAFRFDRVHNAGPAPVRAYTTGNCTGASTLVAAGHSATVTGRSFTVG